jgi:acetyltransferase-like isoleucine patch superfamily enzyme
MPLFIRIYLSICKLYTLLFFRGARLIRLPFFIRNKKYIKIGLNFTTGPGCRIEALPGENVIKGLRNSILIDIGNNVQINDYVHIGSVGNIKIGNNVLIASKVYISDHNHGDYAGELQDSPYVKPMSRTSYSKPIIIGDNVWIGEMVCILPGVEIGKGSIIGALSVVTKSIPENSIAVGSPAIVIKEFDDVSGKWLSVKK